MSDLQGKRILIVGGSSGIGLGVAQQAVADGASVTIASRSRENLERSASSLGGKVEIAVLDTGDEADIEAFFSGSKPWDHVVISAAQTPSGPVRKLSLEDAHKAMDSKFWGAYRVARAVPISDRGSLTFLSGFLSVRPSGSSVLQGAINAALEGLARGLALELSPIRVNAVSPGLTDTPVWAKMEDSARRAMFDRVAASVPAKMVGRPDDIANAIMFLIKTPFATGSTVRVDGGAAIG